MHEPEFDPDEMGPGLVGFVYLLVGAAIAAAGTVVHGIAPAVGRVVVGLGLAIVAGALLLAAALWWDEREPGGDA